LCRQDGTAQLSIFSSILRWFYCSISFAGKTVQLYCQFSSFTLL
jgi:hypothetical protein